METKQKKRRPGRPPIYDEAMIRINIMLTPEQARHLERIGGENRSEGVRRLLRWHEGNSERP